MFSRRDHLLGHKTSLNKFKKTEIISSIFSDHNEVRLEINYKKETTKKNTHKHVEVKHHATKQPMGHWKYKKENLKKSGDKRKWKHNDPKSMISRKSNSKRDAYSDSDLQQQIISQINHLTLHLKELEKQRIHLLMKETQEMQVWSLDWEDLLE